MACPATDNHSSKNHLKNNGNQTVLFIHNMFGSKKSVVRHKKWVESLGYPSHSFDLFFCSSNFKSLLSKKWRYLAKGGFYAWVRDIEEQLDKIPGQKIVFCFSGPSLAAIIACGRRTDVISLICDGGPFLNFFENTMNLFSIDMKIPAQFFFKVCLQAGNLLWQKQAREQFLLTLKNWPSDIPILSIRGMKDPIVPPWTIDKAFKNFNLPLEIFEIPNGKHLDGLKEHSILYKKRVKKFLDKR